VRRYIEASQQATVHWIVEARMSPARMDVRRTEKFSLPSGWSPFTVEDDRRRAEARSARGQDAGRDSKVAERWRAMRSMSVSVSRSVSSAR
jgi:hypothetical protein